MRIYTDETLKRRRLLSVPTLVAAALILGVGGMILLIGIIIGLRTSGSPVMHDVNRWMLDTFLAKRIVTPAVWSAGAMIGPGENVPWNLLKGVTTANTEPMVLDIKWKDLQSIIFKRRQALEEGILFTGPEDYVPVRIRFRGNRYRGKVRLKGRLPDHWSTDKWSLRIRLSGNDTLLGMKRFAIQAPETRNLLSELVSLSLMRREGLLAVKYYFVDVTINGVAKGVYAIEEGSP